jgi:hypothetical protein
VFFTFGRNGVCGHLKSKRFLQGRVMIKRRYATREMFSDPVPWVENPRLPSWGRYATGWVIEEKGFKTLFAATYSDRSL